MYAICTRAVVASRKLLLVIAGLSLVIVMVPRTGHCGEAAPDTVKAHEKISTELAAFDNDPKKAAKGSQSDDCGKYVEGLRIVYERAGYDFDATVRKLPAFIKSAGNEDIANKDMTAYMLTAILVAGLQSECKGGAGNYMRHFDSKTSDAVSEILNPLK